jgi:iron complex outermembrane recepter protein
MHMVNETIASYKSVFKNTGSGLVMACGLAMAAAFPGAAARAETAVPAQDAADQGQEIVVTAQKRVERLQDVPLAVNVATSDQLKAAGVQNMEALGTVIPGLNISHATLGAFVPSIRGISTVLNTSENPTAVYVDGVLIPDQREGFRDLSDVDQITVLKGPQGTLFGRNATAGVIQITTKPPSFTPHGAFSLTYGSYQTVRASGYITGPITDKIAASLTASNTHQNKGFGVSLADGSPSVRVVRDANVRGKILIQPSDTTDITFIADYTDKEDLGQAYQPLPGTSYSNRGVFGTVGTSFGAFVGTIPVAPIAECGELGRYDSCLQAGQSHTHFKGGGVSAELDHEFDFAKFVSITSYRKGRGNYDLPGLPVAAVSLAPSLFIMKSEDFTQELQLVSPSGGRLQWTVGAFYFYSKTAVPNFETDVVLGSAAAPVFWAYTSFISRGTQKADSVAAFVQADYKITDSTTLTLGGRYTYEKRTLVGSSDLVFDGLGGLTVNIPGTPNDTLTAKVPSWRIALTQKLSPTMMAYASYNRGFKSGGYNVVSANSDPFRPEKLDDWEIGLKSELFDRALTFNINGFLYKYKNMQITYYPQGIINARPVVGNAAKSTLYGIDVDFLARLTPELTLNGGAEILHAKFDKFDGAVINTIPTDGGGGLLQVNGSGAGARIPYAQNFSGTLAATYKREIGGINVALNTTAIYQGDYWLDVNFAHQKHYVMLNGSLTFSDLSDRLSLQFSVTNALDEKYLQKVITASFQAEGAYGSPRQFMATLGYKF